MSPLALIPMGIYAIIATVDAEAGLENAKNVADEPEQNHYIFCRIDAYLLKPASSNLGT